MNKKFLLPVAAAAVTLSALTPAQAFDLNVGAEAWNSNLKIDARYKDDPNYFNSDHEYKPVIWATIEHSLPAVPNLKLRYTSLKRDANSMINGEIKIEDTIYRDSTTVLTTTDISHYDVIPYYNLFKNDLFTASLGLDIKIGNYKLEAHDEFGNYDNVGKKGAIPLPYGAASVNLPFNLSLRGDIAGFAISDYAIYDYEVAAAWKAIDTDVLDAAVEVGYRKIYVSGDDFENLDVRAKSDGLFAGVIISY